MDASEKNGANKFCFAYHKSKPLPEPPPHPQPLFMPKMWTLFISCREARDFCLFYLKVIALFIFIFHNIITQSKSHEFGNGKGSFCRKDDECDKRRFLDCVGPDSTCDCNKAAWLIWVSEKNTCMIMEDYPCDRIHDGRQCITNSNCLDGKCICNDGFLRDGFGVCELSYGGVCSETEKCAKRYSLECTEMGNYLPSKCMCKDEGIKLAWDEDKERCVSFAGHSCDLPGNPRFGKDDQLECINNAQCVGVGERGFCECKPGFIQTPESTCMLQFGEMCNDKLRCNTHQLLACSDGKCHCKFYAQMKFDSQANQCRVLVGESCNVKSENSINSTVEPLLKCVTDSYCKPRHPKSSRGTCVCDDGMVTLSDGTCSRYNKGHGLTCSTLIDCNKEKFLECVMDENEGSRCGCRQPDMYFDGKVCRVRAGRSCTENKLCANNSYCEGDWCLCQEGYTVGSTSCTPKGMNNEANLPILETTNPLQIPSTHNLSNCNEFLEGDYDWARCNCQKKFLSHVWSQDECLALVGINCIKDSDCVPNAICDVDFKICQCTAEARTTKDRTCILHSGHTMQPVDPENCECTEMQTLKSVKSQDVSFESGAKAQSATILHFVTIVAVIRQSL